ncbi:hypothetical protein ACH0R4_RS14965 [Bacillus cytotoxicus]|uniref:hypothetical protein n=1 Tax=Bacillus cereus group sp. BfR-BA-01492 TaxID=2920361 RepID=UPI001F5A7729|nr:hypothetical protein [Bacillus cereus group sp. BfR-BA-01492]EMA6344360.1 hypothetical protein [Bacillus cytotoxicus]
MNGNESYREIGKAIGIRDTVVLNWVNQYKQNGVEAFLKRYTNYTQQFKLDVRNFMIENGTSLYFRAQFSCRCTESKMGNRHHRV